MGKYRRKNSSNLWEDSYDFHNSNSYEPISLKFRNNIDNKGQECREYAKVEWGNLLKSRDQNYIGT